jgi:hypothetical protein
VNYRLMLDLEVFEFIAALPRPLQLKLRRRLGELQATPRALRTFRKRTLSAERSNVHIHAGFALYYWEDFADRQSRCSASAERIFEGAARCEAFPSAWTEVIAVVSD